MNTKNEIKIGETTIIVYGNESIRELFALNCFEILTLFELGCTLFEMTNQKMFFKDKFNVFRSHGSHEIFLLRSKTDRNENVNCENFFQIKRFEYVQKDFEINPQYEEGLRCFIDYLLKYSVQYNINQSFKFGIDWFSREHFVEYIDKVLDNFYLLDLCLNYLKTKNLTEYSPYHSQFIELKDRKRNLSEAKDMIEIGVLKKNQRLLIEALENFDKAIQLNERNPAHYYYKSVTLLEMKQYKKALDFCDKALDIDPSKPVLQNLKALILIRLNKYELAEKLSNKVYKINPLDAIFCFQNALVKFEMKNYQEANDYIKKAIEIDPNYNLFYTFNSFILIKLNDFKSASECLDKALENEPSNHFYNYYKALMLVALKEYDQALLFCDVAIEKYLLQFTIFSKSTFCKIYDLKGSILFKLKKFNEANQIYDKLIQANPSKSEYYYKKAYSFRRLEQMESAMLYYKIGNSMAINDKESADSFSRRYTVKSIGSVSITDFQSIIDDKVQRWIDLKDLEVIFRFKKQVDKELYSSFYNKLTDY